MIWGFSLSQQLWELYMELNLKSWNIVLGISFP